MPGVTANGRPPPMMMGPPSDHHGPVNGHALTRGVVGGPPAPSSTGGYYYSRQQQQQQQQHPTTTTTTHYQQHSSGPGSTASGPSKMPSRYTQQANERFGGSAQAGLNSMGRRSMVPMDSDSPSYWIEHLATFAVGKQFGLEWPADGIRKLKQMERNSAIWAQPMVLRLRPHVVIVEDENGELVEQFPMDLVADPTAHLSTDPRDVYNNILLFIVKEDKRASNRVATPTEMHIFQCNRVSANEVVDDLRAFIAGQYNRVRPGRRDTGFIVSTQALNGGQAPAPGEPIVNSYTRTESRDVQQRSNNRRSAELSSSAGRVGAVLANGGSDAMAADESASATSSEGESFERDVNTLNRSFDDIERFVARIQSAAIAQRELEAQATSRRNRRSRSHGDPSILAMRAQLPSEMEFYDILQKFKLCFNLLAKLKNHIHEPNAPELLHFLFTPLTVILDACSWGLGRNIAPQVVSPLLTRETRELLHNCLTSKEHDVWRSLGESWYIPPEDWPGPLPPPYRPVFADGVMPYGPPGAPPMPPPSSTYGGETAAATRQRSVNNLSTDFDRMSTRNMTDRERRLYEAEQRLESERQRLADEKRQWMEDQERRSISSERPIPTYFSSATTERYGTDAVQRESMRSSPAPVPLSARHTVSPSMPNLASTTPRSAFEVDSPRQRAFIADLQQRRARAVRVTYDRVGQNSKELTVSRGEYLEVLNDTKNWWECRNVHNRIGYVPHTILSIIDFASSQPPISNGTTVTAVVGGEQQQQPQPQHNGKQQYSYESSSRHRSAHRTSTHSASQSAQASPRTGEIVEELLPDYPESDDDGLSGGAIPLAESTTLLNSQFSAPPLPPPGPPPDLNDTTATTVTRSHESRDSSVQQTRLQNLSLVTESRQSRLEVLQRGEQENNLQSELLTAMNGGKDQFLNSAARSGNASLIISERSMESEVVEWLKSKGASVRTLQVLAGQTGATLFALTKAQLQTFCGKEEGQRVYSQLLVQKNLTGYNTRTSAELKAILSLRKTKAETPVLPSNTDEPDTSAPSATTTSSRSTAATTTVAKYGSQTNRRPPTAPPRAPTRSLEWHRTVINVPVKHK